MSIVKFESFEKKLISVNNELVLLDKDVAQLYGVEPKKLRQQLKRNLAKFPTNYAYQLSEDELNLMVSQNVTPSKQNFGGVTPWVFTEKGLYMVATILKSKTATEATISIIETFAKLRELNRNINTIITSENEPEQKQLIQKSNEILEDVMDIVFEEKDEDNNITESETKIELNLGFYKKTKTTKRKKE